MLKPTENTRGGCLALFCLDKNLYMVTILYKLHTRRPNENHLTIVNRFGRNSNSLRSVKFCLETYFQITLGILQALTIRRKILQSMSQYRNSLAKKGKQWMGSKTEIQDGAWVRYDECKAANKNATYCHETRIYNAWENWVNISKQREF